MTFPLLFEVGVQAFTGSGVDAHNNEIETWSDTTQHRVYGWSSPKSDEPKVAGHDRVIVDVELLAPEGFPARAHDRVILPDGVFDVIGYAEDYNHGPFGWKPGLVLNLRRSEG